MKNVIKHVMQTFYINENYAKYGVPGMSYFMSLAGVTFLVLLTLSFMLSVILAIFPTLYRIYLSINFGSYSILGAVLLYAIIFLFFKMAFPEEIIKKETITIQKAKKTILYLISYAGVMVIGTGIIALKYLKNAVL